MRVVKLVTVMKMIDTYYVYAIVKLMQCIAKHLTVTFIITCTCILIYCAFDVKSLIYMSIILSIMGHIYEYCSIMGGKISWSLLWCIDLPGKQDEPHLQYDPRWLRIKYIYSPQW